MALITILTKTKLTDSILFEMKDENPILCQRSASSPRQGQLKLIGMTSDPLAESNESSFDSELSL